MDYVLIVGNKHFTFTNNAPEDFKREFMNKFNGQRISDDLFIQMKVFQDQYQHARNNR